MEKIEECFPDDIIAAQKAELEQLKLKVIKLLRKQDDIKNRCQEKLDEMERDYNTKIEYVFKLKKYQIFDDGESPFNREKDKKDKEIQVDDRVEIEKHLRMVTENFTNMKKVEMLQAKIENLVNNVMP